MLTHTSALRFLRSYSLRLNMLATISSQALTRKFLLLTREGCELCEEFEHAVLGHYGAGNIELAREDVDSREDWRRRYGLRVPVLLDEWNEVIAEGHFDPSAMDV